MVIRLKRSIKKSEIVIKVSLETTSGKHLFDLINEESTVSRRKKTCECELSPVEFFSSYNIAEFLSNGGHCEKDTFRLRLIDPAAY